MMRYLQAPLCFTALMAFVGVQGALGTAPTGLLHIGMQKQLMIDNYIIQSLTDARQVVNPVMKHPDNPVLKADRPWEGFTTRPSQVIYDEEEGLFKMWYGTDNTAAAKEGGTMTTFEWKEGRAVRDIVEAPYSYDESPENATSFSCYAVSRDGVHWEKPNLGLVEFQGSKENNILPRESLVPAFKDLHETDPSKRYKAIKRPGDTPNAEGMKLDLHYSADGFHWRPYEGNPVYRSTSFGRWGPMAFIAGGWDPIRKVYAVHMENSYHRRGPIGKRVIGRAESPDLIHWTEAQNIIVPDEDGKDYPDTEFYGMRAFVYEGRYVGLLWNFRTTNTLHYPELVSSRDGIHYERNYREPFIRHGDGGDFDETTIFGLTPIVHDGRIWVYYSGGNYRGPELLYKRGDQAVHAVGLGTVPEDGFVSIDAGKLRPGILITRPFTFEGDELFVNMQAANQNMGAGQVDVRVEILGNDVEPIPGFAWDQANPIRTTGRHRISWQGGADLSALHDRPVQLKIYIRNAKLFSFQFQ